jgi:hypothetical protein
MRPDSVGLDGFDSPTLPPAAALSFRWFVVRWAIASSIALSIVFPVMANAQRPDSARVGVSAPTPAATAPTPDSTRAARRSAKPDVQPPISPGRAFLYSLAIPGLGQAALDRRYTGAGFFLVEAFSLALIYRSNDDLRLAKSFLGDSVPLTYAIDPTTGIAQRNGTGDPVVATWKVSGYTPELIKARKLQVEDWIAVVLFNHLFAGADAFVAAQLWDLPSHVALRAAPLPRGGTSVSMSLRFR